MTPQKVETPLRNDHSNSQQEAVAETKYGKAGDDFKAGVQSISIAEQGEHTVVEIPSAGKLQVVHHDVVHVSAPSGSDCPDSPARNAPPRLPQDQATCAQCLPSMVVVESEDVYPKSKSLRCCVFFRKCRGQLDTPLKRETPLEFFFSWLGAFLGILLVAGLNHTITPKVNLPLLVASFGASAVLIFGVPESKLAQPRNFIGGQVFSAIVGCSVRLLLKDVVWLSSAVGMSLSLFVMQLTGTTHPPGGATALIAASAQHLAPWAGFQFVLTVLLGSLGMLVVALVVNNLSPTRRYPTFW